MTILLMYIEGISRIDTPYFATKTSQASLSKQMEYMFAHTVKTIESSYYPPHYNNTIRFDTEDVDFKTNINYLGLVYDGKTYFYFIDDFRYVSESIVEVDITMDVIQTYMFDIYISNGIVERKFINRFVLNPLDSTLRMNRNYIRENVSCNEFYISSKTYMNTDISKYVLFVKQSKFDKSNTYGNICPRNVISYWVNSNTLSDKFPISLAVPYDIKFGPGSPYGFIKNDSSKVAYNTYLVATGSYLAETLDMYVCPFNPFMKINMSTPSGGNVTLSGNVEDTNYLNFDDMHGETVYYNKALYDQYDLAIRTTTIGISASLQTAKGVAFSSNYLPQMVDDNYQRWTFGTSACSTTHPIYPSTLGYLGFHYTFDITNGSRIYFMNMDDDRSTDTDKYNTMVIDTNILSVDLKNTPWAQYIANNKNRWAQLNNNNIASITQAGANYAGGLSKIGKIGVDKTSSTKYSYAKVQGRNKSGQFSRGVMRRVGTDKVSSSRDVYGEVPSNSNAGGLVSSVVGAGANIIDQYYTEKNLLAAPSSLSQLGECINGFISQAHLIFRQQEKVIDYEQCAQYYHRNGYLVNDHVNSISNIFSYVQNRYYFNILKMSVAEVHLHNVIEDETTIDEIKVRLEDGIRLWNINNDGVTMGNFYYDNVEYSALP